MAFSNDDPLEIVEKGQCPDCLEHAFGVFRLLGLRDALSKLSDGQAVLSCQLCNCHTCLRDFGAGAQFFEVGPLRFQKRLDARPDLFADCQLRLLFRSEFSCADFNGASAAALIPSNGVEEFDRFSFPTRGDLEVLQPFVVVHTRVSDALHDFHRRPRQVVRGEGALVDLKLALGDEVFEGEGLHVDSGHFVWISVRGLTGLMTQKSLKDSIVKEHASGIMG